jgi:DNA-binding CsgD family transcriptional regulator
MGEFESARADHEAALAYARAAGDGRTEWRIQLELGFLWAGRDYAHAGNCWERALAVARSLSEPARVADSLNRIGNWRVNLARPDEGLRDHLEALDLFQEVADRRGIAETLDFLGLAAFETGDLVQSAAWYRQAIPMLEDVDDRPRLVFALNLLMAASAGMYGTEAEIPAEGDATTPWQKGERALAIARAIGWPAGEAYTRIQLSGCYGPRGEYARALDEARTALSIAQAIGHRQWTCAALFLLGAIYGDLLACEKAQPLLERATALAQEAGSTLLFTFAAALHAQVCVRGRDFERAESALAAIDAVRPPGRLIFGRLATATRAELLLARRRPEPALRMLDDLLAPVGDTVIPYLWKLRGEALTALHRYVEAEEVLRRAETAAGTLGSRSLEWRIAISIGKLYRAWGRTADAARAYEAARAQIDDLAGNIPDEDVDDRRTLREHFHAAALELLPRPRPATSLRSAKQAFGGLTARERDVAALIAGGMSNRDIAEVLVLSERTVESHVSNILVKLGCGTRAAIAAWAVKKGLLAGATPP